MGIYDPKYPLFGSGLGTLLGGYTPPPPNPLAPERDALSTFGSAFGGLAPVPPSPNWLDDLVTRPSPALRAAPIKRKAFFSFHFDDIMRVNVVRNAWKIGHPDTALMRSFYDSSLWESKKLEGPEAVKRLIRDGVGYTSAVCVLVGSTPGCADGSNRNCPRDHR